MKVATFTVRADTKQSARWKQIAEREGFPTVGGWLAAAADAYLKARDRAGRPVPLAWRCGRFSVVLATGETRSVSGLVSLPFGTYRGTALGLVGRGQHHHTLVYVPTGRILATVSLRRDVRQIAAELARVWVRWDGGGTEPPSQDVTALLRQFQPALLG